MRNPPHDALVRFDVDSAAAVTETADCLSGIELPRVVGEVAISERADRPKAGEMLASRLRMVDSIAVTPITSSHTRVQRVHMMQRSHL
jgi:hypothetical protein